MEAIGIFEVSGIVAGINALDAALKTADVRVLTWEKRLGGRLVSIVLQGSVSSVREAIEQAEIVGNKITHTVATALINNPCEEVMKQIELSSLKYAKKEM